MGFSTCIRFRCLLLNVCLHNVKFLSLRQETGMLFRSVAVFKNVVAESRAVDCAERSQTASSFTAKIQYFSNLLLSAFAFLRIIFSIGNYSALVLGSLTSFFRLNMAHSLSKSLSCNPFHMPTAFMINDIHKQHHRTVLCTSSLPVQQLVPEFQKRLG